MPTSPNPDIVDVRGPRFAAWITTFVLVTALAVAAFSTLAGALVLAVQAAIFLWGALSGPRRSPYGLGYATLVAPRLKPVSETEPVAPLKFAQLVGFLFTALSVISFLTGAPLVGSVLAGFALFAALLNAAFGICLGCQAYPLVLRLRDLARPHPA